MFGQALKDISSKVLSALNAAPANFLDSYPDGAVLVSLDGVVLGSNEEGGPLAALISDRSHAVLNDFLQQVQNDGGAKLEGVTVNTDTLIDITAVPVQDGEAILLLARDQTFERNMLTALIDSRARYKDFVDVSSDFAWEIGPEGTFVFVSPSGALDYSSDDFIGQNPEKFGFTPLKRRDLSPFFAAEPTSDIDVYMQRADGMAAQLKVSALPLFDKQGKWCGSRGVCRDFTEEGLRKLALDEARIREKLLKHLVGIIRDEVDPLKTLIGSIRYIVRASSFDGCKVFTRDEYSGHGENFVLAAEYGSESGMPPESEVMLLVEKVNGTEQIEGDGWGGLLAMTSYRQHVNGAICVWRGDGSTDWSADEMALIDTVSDQLGIAIERVMHHERILRVSRTDELTGLLNRRAFLEEELPRRMDRLKHSGGAAALLFVDLDNFKMVNDVHGHHRGDEALIFLARFLEKNSRPGDAIARFGGDEFAMWLDGMDAESVEKRAQAMIDDSRVFKEYSGDNDHPLGFSIGISMYTSDSDEHVDHLIRRADEAMYKVKRHGKGGFAFDDGFTPGS